MSGGVTIKWDEIGNILGRRGLEVSGKVQRFVDSEVLRRSSPYVPHLTGTLERSGSLSTKPGSGVVKWNTPYAKRQYYNTPSTRDYDALRGGQWFERMKNSHGKEIIDAAARMAGGKPE